MQDSTNMLAYRNWCLYYSLKGEKEKALDNLKKAAELGYSNIKWLSTEKGLGSIRKDQRFKATIQTLQNSKINN